MNLVVLCEGPSFWAPAAFVARHVSAYWLRVRFMIKTCHLPGFSHRLCDHQTRPQTEGIREKAEELHDLATVLTQFIPRRILQTGEHQRERIFTTWVTFVAFLGQVLTRGSSCREAVRRVQAWRAATKRCVPDGNSSACCQARSLVAADVVEGARVPRRMDAAAPRRSVAVVRSLGQSARWLRSVDAGYRGQSHSLTLRRQAEAQLRVSHNPNGQVVLPGHRSARSSPTDEPKPPSASAPTGSGS